MRFTFRVNGVAGIDLWLTLTWFVLGFRSWNPRLSRCFSITTFLIQRIQSSSWGLNIFTFSIRRIQHIHSSNKLPSTKKNIIDTCFPTFDWGGADLRRFGSPLSYSPIFSDGIIYFEGNDLVRLGPTGGLSSNPGILIIFFSEHQYIISSYNLKIFCTLLYFYPVYSKALISPHMALTLSIFVCVQL